MNLVKRKSYLNDYSTNGFTNLIDTLMGVGLLNNNTDLSFVPGAEISETDDAYEVSLALPGIKKEDVNIHIENNQLVISGEKKLEETKEEKKYHVTEISYGSFKRLFHLPDAVNVKEVKAKYEDGILKIYIPKDKNNPNKKQIEIQ